MVTRNMVPDIPIAVSICDRKFPFNSFAISALKITNIPLNKAGKNRTENNE